MEDSAYVQAKSTLDALMLSYQLLNAIQVKKIDPSVLMGQLVVKQDGGPGITVSSTGNAKSIIVVVDNLRKYLIGTCFIAFDRALDNTLGRKPNGYSQDSEIDCLRVIIYMLRCAYAHNPAAPAWKITHVKDQKAFSIPRIGLTLDFQALNGQLFDVRDCGGWDSIHRLLLYALQVIKPHH